MLHRLLRWTYFPVVLFGATLLITATYLTGVELGWIPVRHNAQPIFTQAHGNLQLFTHRGDTLPLTALQGHLLIIHTFFTRCGGICPRMISNLKQMLTTCLDSTPPVQLRILSLSVDPAYDQPDRLFRYHQRMHLPDFWILATGNKSELYPFLVDVLGLHALARTQNGNQTIDFIHSEEGILIDEHGFVIGAYDLTSPRALHRLCRTLRYHLSSTSK